MSSTGKNSCNANQEQGTVISIQIKLRFARFTSWSRGLQQQKAQRKGVKLHTGGRKHLFFHFRPPRVPFFYASLSPSLVSGFSFGVKQHPRGNNTHWVRHWIQKTWLVELLRFPGLTVSINKTPPVEFYFEKFITIVACSHGAWFGVRRWIYRSGEQTR